jgi:hypothetical protein
MRIIAQNSRFQLGKAELEIAGQRSRSFDWSSASHVFLAEQMVYRKVVGPGNRGYINIHSETIYGTELGKNCKGVHKSAQTRRSCPNQKKLFQSAKLATKSTWRVRCLFADIVNYFR